MSISTRSSSSSSSSSTCSSNPTPAKRPALRLISTKDLPRQDWLEVRRHGIGSSDAAAAVGLSPYQSQLELWMHKSGRADLLPSTDPFDETSPLYWGSLLEPIVAAHYTRRSGHKVRRVNAVLQHPDHPWMLANLDREVVGQRHVQILECKTAGLHGARLWRDGVPEYVQLQVMHQLAVTGHQAADVAVLICGQELQIHRIERDDRLIAQLIELEQQFWSWVQSDQEPPADGSQSAERALRCLYPLDCEETLDLNDDVGSTGDFNQLLHVRQQLTQIQAQHDLLKHRIVQRMGSACRALFANGSISYRRSKDSLVLDSARLQREHPELVQAYMTPQPGSRRFLVQTQR